MIPHKVVLRVNKAKQTTVSCICRAVFERHGRNPPDDYYEPMGTLQPGQSMWDLYNDPENHWTDFTEEDKVHV